MENERVQTVSEWPEPTCQRDIRAFIGFASFYRRFIHAFSRIAAPLNDLLKGDAKRKFEMTPEARESFNQLKEAFTKAPVLIHFDADKLIRIETDASSKAIAAILTQPREDRGL